MFKENKIKPKNLWFVLILAFGIMLMFWIWFYYNWQLNEIENAIEQVNKK